MYIVIGMTQSRAMRVLWMLEELAQPYELSRPCRAARGWSTFPFEAPGIATYLERMSARPAYWRARASGG
ncbi:hypothetical protein [Maritimibacter sp. 55A14]|uniref:hypothetical protein n=1 Tax=Maritimibacter sp. 55A14 TaxID=2174844 RepID=UPI001E4055AD|nr:hypothetical protein [Maritimibacter sp. 55A14]